MTEQEMYNRISIVNVKNKLKLQEIYSTGEKIYVKCPFCFLKNGTMKLNTSNNSYICNNCEECGYSIGLYAKCKCISNKKAYQELITRKANFDSTVKNSVIVTHKKNTDELDEIYNSFLQKLKLNNEHIMKLITLGFTLEEIKYIGFKSIPTNEQQKISICQELIKEGIELRGTPGFYQDIKFRWTFKSHNGIFIPIKNNCKIEALRIHLDSPYKYNTTDIWFSSSNKNNGCKINNQIMMLIPRKSQIHILNDKKNIIIASEMILAYKIFCRFQNTVTIGIPNVLAKSETKKLEKIKRINKIFLIMDKHTIEHNSINLINGLIKQYGEEKIQILHSLNECEIPNNLMEKYSKENCKLLTSNIA